MFSPNVLEMLKGLIDCGIEVSLHKNAEGVYYADLHTRAKSHLHVHETENEVVFSMRYGKNEIVDKDNDADALTYHAASCYAYGCICGRSFGSADWDAICKSYSITVEYGHL